MGQAVAAGINKSSQQETNATNLQIARENNQSQIDLWREQMAYDLDMWNRENEYNSPSEQVKRLQAAGINPLMLDGFNPSGNATGSAGGQTPPQLITPHLEAPKISLEGIDQFAQAYRNVMEGRKLDAEGKIAGIQEDFYKDMALKGFNPDLIKASYMLQMYNNLKKSGKYIAPYMEEQIKKLGAETDFYSASMKERLERSKQIVEEARGLAITNDFNAKKAPIQLAQLGQDLKTSYERHKVDMALTGSQIQLNQANAGLAGAQEGLVTQQQKTESMKTIQEGFKAGLSKMGINPNAANLPFYAGLALRLTTGEVKPWQIEDYFQKMVEAEQAGAKGLASGNHDLTQFELWNRPNGLFGSGFNTNTGLNGDFIETFLKPLGIEKLNK